MDYHQVVARSKASAASSEATTSVSKPGAAAKHCSCSQCRHCAAAQSSAACARSDLTALLRLREPLQTVDSCSCILCRAGAAIRVVIVAPDDWRVAAADFGKLWATQAGEVAFGSALMSLSWISQLRKASRWSHWSCYRSLTARSVLQ